MEKVFVLIDFKIDCRAEEDIAASISNHNFEEIWEAKKVFSCRKRDEKCDPKYGEEN